MAKPFIKTHQENDLTIILEASMVNGTPFLIATIDFGISKNIRSLKRSYRASSLESAKFKVINSTLSDVRKVLSSMKEEMDFTLSLESVLKMPLVLESENKKELDRLIKLKNQKLSHSH